MATKQSMIQAKYDAKNSKVYSLKFNRKTDAEIIEKLDQVESRNGYIKQLIRDDLARTCSVPKQEGSVPKNIDSVPDSSIITPQEKIRDVINQWAEYKGLTPEEFIKQLQESVLENSDSVPKAE